MTHYHETQEEAQVCGSDVRECGGYREPNPARRVLNSTPIREVERPGDKMRRLHLAGERLLMDAERKAERAIVVAIATAAAEAKSWGDQCAGGAGGQEIPNSGGKVYGEGYYNLAEAILRIKICPKCLARIHGQHTCERR